MTSMQGSRRRRGFTLIETLVATAIAGILSSVAYPSFEGHVLRARRSDGLMALLQAQLAEERHRANNNSYGTLAETGLRSTSPAGYYALQVTTNTADAYSLLASAIGGQARDVACRHLRMSSQGAGLAFASGPDTTTANPAAANRKCWNL
ncbi:MAG: type IV pilin protein [Caldimonas sp.]